MKYFTLKMVLILTVSFIFSISTFAQSGGQGGGHDLGIFAKREFGTVLDVIEQSKNLYTEEQKKILKLRFESITSVLIVEEDLPAGNEEHRLGEHFIQKGTAYSQFDGSHSSVKFNSNKFSSIADPVAIEGLLHHELAVLANLESTGDYTYTDRFMEFREKFWNSSSMLCTASVFSKKSCQLEPEKMCPDELEGAASTPLYSNPNNVYSNLLWLKDLAPRNKKKRNTAVDSLVLRYAIAPNGVFRASVSKVATSYFSPKDKTPTFFSEPPVDLTNVITYYNVYDWMSASREARLREFDLGFIMISCVRY